MKQLILFLLLISACAYLPTKGPDPLDNNVPEIAFRYLKGDKYIEAYGQASDFFSIGDRKSIQILSPEDKGEITFLSNSGNTHIVKSIDKKGWIDIEFGKYSSFDGDPIEFAITTPSYGIQFGKFFPVINRVLEYNQLFSVYFKCPYSTDIDGTATCIRPAGFDFKILSWVAQSVSGQIRAITKDCDGNFEDVKAFINGGVFTFKHYVKNAQYCRFRIDLKAVKKDGQKIKKSKEINVIFYKNSYRPLPEPKVTKEDTAWKVCGLDEYDLYSINDEYNTTGFLSKNCKIIKGDEPIVYGWDRAGRFVWYNPNIQNNRNKINNLPEFISLEETCLSIEEEALRALTKNDR